MKIILTSLILIIFSITSFAGGSSSTIQKINYKILSFKTAEGYMSKAFINEADMMITLTLNSNKEFTYMENRWLHFNSSSVGVLVTLKPNQYQWNPINNYDKERNECVITTSEKLINSKYIRTFWIDVNHGKEKLVIVAEKI